MSESERDSHFKGFAELLWREVDTAIGETAQRMAYTDISKQEFTHHIGSIIARGFYDFACYIQRCEIRNPRLTVNLPFTPDMEEYIAMVVARIPDIQHRNDIEHTHNP